MRGNRYDLEEVETKGERFYEDWPEPHSSFYSTYDPRPRPMQYYHIALDSIAVEPNGALSASVKKKLKKKLKYLVEWDDTLRYMNIYDQFLIEGLSPFSPLGIKMKLKYGKYTQKRADDCEKAYWE